MRFDEELEGDPRCKECLGRGLIVRVRGKAHHIDKCDCVRPVNRDPVGETHIIFGKEVKVNAGRS